MPRASDCLFALSLGFAGLIWATQHAQGQSLRPLQCGPRANVMEVLATRYGETRRGIGMAGTTGVVEVFASPKTGSWTVTLSLPDGRSCLLASGTGWESLNDELPAKANPT